MNKNINSTIAISIIALLVIVLGYFIWASCQFLVINSTQQTATQRINSNKPIAEVAKTKQEITTTDYIYKLANDSCTIKSCMLAPQTDPEALVPSIGIARLKGYYKKVTKTTVPIGCDNEDKSADCKEYTSDCEQFVVTDGLENAYPKQLGFNNTENAIAIDLEGSNYTALAEDKFAKLSQTEKSSLINSNMNNQVEIVIFKYKSVLATEVGPCYADNVILKVN